MDTDIDTILDALVGEHRALESLLDRLRPGNAAPTEVPDSLLDEMEVALTNHLRIEETELRLRLEHADSESAERSRVQQQEIHDALADVRSRGAADRGIDLVRRLDAAVRKHITEAEQTAFPALRSPV